MCYNAFIQERELIKQIININRKKFATGLFWQPLGLGNTAHNYAKYLSKTSDKKYTLFTEYKAMIGLVSGREGAHIGMVSAAAEVAGSLSDLISFLGVFLVDKHFYVIAVRNGVIIRDLLVESEDEARKLYTELSILPDWGALFAPASWGMPKSQEKNIRDLIKNVGFARLRPIGVVKSLWPSVLFSVLFVLFGFYIISHPVSKKGDKKSVGINSEMAAEYRRQIEIKKQEQEIRKQESLEPLHYPYDYLPNVMERARLCYKAIGFVMQPVMGWNQTYTKCDEQYVSATFTRDFGTLNEFYEYGAVLMPGAMVQQISENEILVRIKLPELKTFASQDERDQIAVARDIATNFQKINAKPEINVVMDTVTNGAESANINIVEVAASSKLIPTEFMQIFKDFEGVYMTSAVWKVNTRTWNYEVVIYTK